MKEHDYRVRLMNEETEQQLAFLEAVKNLSINKLKKNEAALINNRFIVFENTTLDVHSIITAKNPKKSKIDYVSRLSEESEKESLNNFIKMYNLKQGQLKEIISQYKRKIQDLEKQFQRMQDHTINIEDVLKEEKEKALKEITVDIVNQEQLNRWLSKFEKHYYGIIECLSLDDGVTLPLEIIKEIDNKREIILTYFEDIISEKV